MRRQRRIAPGKKNPMNAPRTQACSLLGVLLLLAASAALAQVSVTQPWVRGTVAGMKSTGAYMQIVARSDTRLVGASSPAARVVEVHEMTMVDNVMRMRAVPSIPLPAGRTLELRPGGYHVMLIDLVKPLATGSRVPITLEFEGRDGKRETVAVEAEVRPLTATAPGTSPAQGAPQQHHHSR